MASDLVEVVVTFLKTDMHFFSGRGGSYWPLRRIAILSRTDAAFSGLSCMPAGMLVEMPTA